MPPPPSQLTLRIPSLLCDIACAPTRVFRRIPHRQPEPLEVMSRLGVHVVHLAHEKLVMERLVETLGVSLNGFFPDSEEGAGVEADGGWYRCAGEHLLPILSGGSLGTGAGH